MKLSLASAVYFLVAAAIIVVIFIVFIRPVAVVSYERDIWHHLSVYRELIASPFYAANPHVATHDPSRSYSPWTMGVAIIARTAGLDNFGAIMLSAVGSTAIILLGVYLFARRYWATDVAPLLLLVVMFGTWMVQVDHTGYHTIGTSLFSIAYPYSSVLGMGFLSWWVALGAVRSTGVTWKYALALSLISYVMFVTHQLQALFGIGMTGAFLLFAPGEAEQRQRILLAMSLAAGVLVTQWWWYFDPIAYILNPAVQTGHGAVRFLTYSLDAYPKILETLGLAVFGILGLVEWGKPLVGRELRVPFLIIMGGFAVLLAKGNWVNVRILPFVALVLQLALVSFIVRKNKSMVGAGASLLLVAAIFWNLNGAAIAGYHKYMRARTFLDTGEVRFLPGNWSRDILAASKYAESLAPPGSAAIAHLQTAFPIEATSLSVVAIPRLFAEVPDMRARQEDNATFFDPDTGQSARCEILRKYGVSLIVWRDVWLDERASAGLQEFGEHTRYGDLSFIVAGAEGFANCPG